MEYSADERQPAIRISIGLLSDVGVALHVHRRDRLIWIFLHMAYVQSFLYQKINGQSCVEQREKHIGPSCCAKHSFFNHIIDRGPFAALTTASSAAGATASARTTAGAASA